MMPDMNRKRRNRRQARKAYFWFVAVSLALVVGFVAGVVFYVTRPVQFTVAVPAGSEIDQQILTEAGRVFTRQRASVRLSVVSVSDQRTALDRTSAASGQLAVVRADESIPPEMTAVAILRKESLIIWTPTRPKIESLDQLVGKRIAVIQANPKDEQLVRTLLGQAGLPADRAQVVGYSPTDMRSMIRDSANLAFAAFLPLGDKLLAEALAETAAARGEPRFITFSSSEAVAKASPVFEATEIPERAFGATPPRPSEKIDTVSLGVLVVAPRRLDETGVVALSRQFFDHRQAILKGFPTSDYLQAPDTSKDAPVPAHPGAAAYIDGTDRTFLERYSDFIWAGLLLLSGIGSSGAWLRSYLKRGERERYLASRDRMLQRIKSVRGAGSLEELDRLQTELDESLSETLDLYEDGAIGQASLLGFGLVLEQFHAAVSDRRAALGAERR